MKRGKVDDKVMGPMFPRLHVNDTEKGGPRAPPRNKMALYEQLSIPSQRFNQGWLPVRPDSVNSVPPPSSSQVNGADRKIFFPVHLPHSNPTFIPEKLNGLESDRYNTNTSLTRLEQQNKSGDEDDYTVPVFAHSPEVQEKNQNSKNNKDFLPISPNHLCHNSMTQTQNIGPEKNLAKPKNVDRESKEADSSHESGNNESPREIEVANSSKPKSDSPSGPTVKSEDVSEASILDSVSAMDISPDEAVGIIGQKHFWKARRAIVNQQRVFAGQVFELHRLIKVQKLIAGSPHLLLEDASSTLSKPSSASSPATKPLVENNNKSLSPATKHIDKPQKPNQPMECSAENAVGRTPVSANNGAPHDPPTVPSSGAWCPPQHQAPGQQQWLIPVMSPTEGLVYKPYPGPGFSSTGFCGPYGSSPMTMSNYGNPAYGVPAVQGMGFVPGIPHAGHSYFPNYGMPVMRVGDSDGGSCSVSVSATEQVNHRTEPTPGIQTGHVPRQEPKQPQLQSLCNSINVPVPRTAPTSASLQPLKFSDLQGSTGSSRSRDDRGEPTQTASSQHPCPSNEPTATKRGSFSKRARDPGNVRRKDGKDELPLFPMTPATADTELSARVIRAVPHSARTASASAARIFRSIQDERKHYDSV